MNSGEFTLAVLAVVVIVGLLMLGSALRGARRTALRGSDAAGRGGIAAGSADSSGYNESAKPLASTAPSASTSDPAATGGDTSTPAVAIQGAAGLSGFGAGVTVAQGLTVANAVVAVFSPFAERDASHDASRFQAMIWWGDGNAPSIGTITGTGNTFAVRGTHAYALPGVYDLRVEMSDGQGPPATASARAHIGSVAERFVAQIGTLLLHRSLTATELDRYSMEARHDTSPVSVVAAMLQIDGNRSALVEELYRSLLVRPPTPEERDHATGQMASGTSALALAAQLLGSSEYARRRGAESAGFLAALAAMAFGRELDPQEEQNWRQQLERGTPRESLAAAVLDSPEARGYQTRRLREQLLGSLSADRRLGQRGGAGDSSTQSLGGQLPIGAYVVDSSLQQQIWQSLYPLLFPLLDTDYQNPLPGQSPSDYTQPPSLQPVDPTYPYWTYQFVGGQRALINEQPPFEWMPVLRTLAPGDTVVPTDEKASFVDRIEWGNGDVTGVSGTAVLNGPLRDDAHPFLGGKDYLVSDHDVPFSHPLGNDAEFFVVPDSSYVSLLGPTNLRVYAPLALQGEFPAAIAKALAPDPAGVGLSDATVNGVLGIEMDAACLPKDYRPQDGDRVAIFGRWIVDTGHEDFHTEIHPPLVVAGARRQDTDSTHSWLIARPYRVSQIFPDSDGNRTQGIRGALESQVTAQVTSFVLAPLGSKPAPVQLDLTPEIQGGMLPSGFYYGGGRGVLPHKVFITTTLSYYVRPPTPRAAATDQLLVTWHFTVRTGVDVYMLNTGLDEVKVVLDIGRTTYTPAKVPTDGRSITVYVDQLQNPELVAALAQKRQDIARDHGDDVGDFFWQLISLGARSTVFDSPTWPQPRSVAADSVNVVFEQDVGTLPPAETFIPGQTQRAAVAVDDEQAFPIYGLVDVQWRRAKP